MKYLISLLLVTSAIACNSKKSAPDPGEPRDGGPCTYRYDTLPARVVKINRLDSTHATLVLAVLQRSGRADTLYYSGQNKAGVPDEVITQKGITAGAVVQNIVGEIKTGACNPNTGHIELEKYTGKLPEPRDTMNF